MKKQLLSLGLGLLAAGAVTAQSIPNNSFENWNVYAWMDPTGYMSANDNYAFFGVAPSVTRVSPGQHGSYAVQMKSQVIGTDTVAGFVVDGNPNGTSVQGGIPYAQKPTGLRVYYKYSTTQKDTALILAFFKKSGTVIGEYIGKLSAQASSFTLASETFTPALAITPDTVVFGAATSSNVFNNGRGRAGSVLTIDSVTFTGVTSQPALLNGDFETWTADTTLNLQNWLTNSYPSAERTTDAFAGKYALQLNTLGANQNQNSPQAGNADDGTLVVSSKTGNDTVVGGYPYGLMVDTLMLSYKYAPADTADRATVELQFKKSGVVTATVVSSLTAAASYSTVEVPFGLSTAPDSVITYLSSSTYTMTGIPNSYVGAVFKVDNIYLKSQASTVGIAPIIADGNIKLYPNPATTSFTVDMSGFNGNLQSITVYDMTGKAIATKNFMFMASKTGIETFDVSGYSAGVYNVVIRTDKGVKYEKVTKI